MAIHTLMLALLSAALAIQHVSGHGRMLDPPNRSSLWRFDPTAPINYNDNELFCGGFSVHWNTYKGKCGICGDSYGDSIPRPNENTGTYGIGKVVKSYTSGSIVPINIELTTNHKGTFKFSLCNLEDPSRPENEECFQPVFFEDGSSELKIDASQKIFNFNVRLPSGLKCNRCVLRWTYRSGNNWGICDDGTGALGCGPQETFKNCADIAIF